MSSAYLGPRNKPGRLKTITFGLKLVIDKTLGSSDKIILPETVINEIMREFSNPPNPIIFEIHSVINYNKGDKPQLHCGVLEFTADRNTARIPYWMTYCLKKGNGQRVKEGDRMKFKLIRALEPARFAKFRPLDKRFARDIQTPRASLSRFLFDSLMMGLLILLIIDCIDDAILRLNRLEHALRKFTVLTAGQRIPIIHDGKVYPLQVEDVNPSPAGHLIDTNLQVEFTAFDEEKLMDQQDDIKGLINGNKEEKKDDDNDDDDEDDDRYAEVEEIALYTTITNTAKFVSFLFLVLMI